MLIIKKNKLFQINIFSHSKSKSAHAKNLQMCKSAYENRRGRTSGPHAWTLVESAKGSDKGRAPLSPPATPRLGLPRPKVGDAFDDVIAGFQGVGESAPVHVPDALRPRAGMCELFRIFNFIYSFE